MAVFPLQVFTQDNALVDYAEDYKTSPIGIQFAGQPKGSYLGFTPSVLGSVLTLALDPTYSISLVKVDSDIDPGGMDVFVPFPIVLDFTGQPDVDFPMNVMVRVSYYADGSVPTSAEVFSRSATVAVSASEALICVVDGPAAALTLFSDPTIQQRDEPLAHDNVDFGYMPGGSVESLQAAADIVNEVIAARIGLNGTVHADLSARIAEDYGAASMAGRLAVLYRALRSNDYAVSAGQEEVTVSGSFTEIDRDHGPMVTLSGVGDETVEGAIAGPNDNVRNVVLLVDADTGYRPVDDPTDRQTVFARLIGPGQAGISGEWRFLNASKDVAATDGNGQATVEISIGDTILGPDGNQYEVATIVDDNTLILRTAYQGATETSAATSIDRWQLQLKKIVAGIEVAASLPDDANIRFFFPAFVSMERSNADWKLAMHTAAEREPLPVATTAIPGAVRLAESGALLGSVNIQNVGAPLGGGPFHTINFSAANASVVAVPANPGEVEVAEIGAMGAMGADGASGGAGIPGGPGPGFSALNPFEASNEFGPSLGVTTMFSFTKDMGHNVRYLSGGVAKMRDQGFFTAGGDKWLATDVVIASATEGRIDVSFGGMFGDMFVTAFLSSAGD